LPNEFFATIGNDVVVDAATAATLELDAPGYFNIEY
jgi:hypothetical protein